MTPANSSSLSLIVAEPFLLYPADIVLSPGLDNIKIELVFMVFTRPFVTESFQSQLLLVPSGGPVSPSLESCQKVGRILCWAPHKVDSYVRL